MKRYKDKEYGVSTLLIKIYGSLEKVLESRVQIDRARELSSVKYEEVISQILDTPKSTLNWEHNIAMLIGTARAHKSDRDMYTIKEKVNV